MNDVVEVTHYVQRTRSSHPLLAAAAAGYAAENTLTSMRTAAVESMLQLLLMFYPSTAAAAAAVNRPQGSPKGTPNKFHGKSRLIWIKLLSNGKGCGEDSLIHL